MARGDFDLPGSTPFSDEAGNVFPPWGQWLQRIHSIATANRRSGPTAERPDKNLWIGLRYYDTTLSKPVFISAVKPAIIWRDATGAVV